MSTPERPTSTDDRLDGIPVETERGRETEPATTQPHGPGVVKRTTSTVKRVVLVVLGALIALFAVFNSQDVEVDWIFGNSQVQTPLILVIAASLVIGIIIGWILAKLNGRKGD